MTPDDRQLVAEAASGSRAAGSELFERHWHAAWRLAYSLTRERATADDIAQDAFERAFRGLASAGRAVDGIELTEIEVSRLITLWTN